VLPVCRKLTPYISHVIHFTFTIDWRITLSPFLQMKKLEVREVKSCVWVIHTEKNYILNLLLYDPILLISAHQAISSRGQRHLPSTLLEEPPSVPGTDSCDWLLQMAQWAGVRLWPCSGLKRRQLFNILLPFRGEVWVLSLWIWWTYWVICGTWDTEQLLCPRKTTCRFGLSLLEHSLSGHTTEDAPVEPVCMDMYLWVCGCSDQQP
jgi:hypothetical protein